jgi:hypothetical protein
MKFACHLVESGALWIAEHASPGVGPIRVTAPTRQEALQKLEAEIRYWLEMCPCTGERYRDIQIELVSSSRSQ